MSQINSNTKDDFQVVFLLSCFVGHPVSKVSDIEMYRYRDKKIRVCDKNSILLYGFYSTLIGMSRL